jgi:putative spermidine/putrescine transport system substrate-binding protein
MKMIKQKYRRASMKPKAALRMAAMAGVAMSLLSATADAQQRFDGVILRVATYGGGWDKAVHDFAGVQLEKLGAKVEYVTGTPRDSLAKLIAAKGRPAPFDVVEMADNTWVDTHEGGFLQKINLDKIVNKKDLLPSQYDEYKVASWNTQEGIIYNVEKFRELGIPVPQRYSDLLHPKLSGKVSVIDIAPAGSVQLLVGAATDAGGSVENLDAGFQWLRQVNAFKFWKVGAEAVTLLQTGDIYAATMHAGFAVQTRRNGMPTAFVHPQVKNHKGILKEGWLGVVKGTKNAEAAEFFINAYIDTETQLNLAKRRGVVPVNGAARAQLGDDPVLKDIFLLSQNDVANMLQVDFTKIDLGAVTQKWTRTVAK